MTIAAVWLPAAETQTVSQPHYVGWRKEKKMVHENDDLWYAIENNTPEKFSRDDIADIVVEVPGENDEFAWWWVLQLKNGKHVLLAASCDYTGWDCRSGIDFEEVYDTAEQATEAAPEKEEYSGRAIRQNLVGQLNGQYPKFTYWSAG